MRNRALALLVAAFLPLFGTLPAWAVPTTLTVQQAPSVYSTISAGAATVTMVAGDVSNGNDFVSSGDEEIILNNTGVSAYTVTVTSVADSLGRTKDIATYSIAAGAIARFGPFPPHGWKDANGKIKFTVSNALVYVGVVRLPSNR